MAKEGNESTKSTIKTRGKSARNESSMFGEDIKDITLAEQLNNEAQTVKCGRSRLTSKIGSQLSEESGQKDESGEEQKKKEPAKKKMLLKPMIYDYKKMNPNKEVKKKEENEEKDPLEADCSTRSLLGSPGHLDTPLSPTKKQSGTSTSTESLYSTTTNNSSSGSTCYSNCSTSDASSKSIKDGKSLLKSSKSTGSLNANRPHRIRTMSKRRPLALMGKKPPQTGNPIPTMIVTISSVMAGFKPYKVQLPTTATVLQLKNIVKTKTKIRKFFLSFNGKELKPEDSTLASHEIKDGAIIQCQVKSTAGTNDREELAALLRLSKPLADFRNLLENISSEEAIDEKKDDPKKIDSPINENDRNQEFAKTKNKMKMLKEKIRERSAERTPDLSIQRPPKRVFGRKSENESESDASTGSVWTDLSYYSDCSETDKDKEKMTEKEASAFHDVFESKEAKDIRDHELFDVPSSKGKWKETKEEFSNRRCSFCLQKLKLTLREMKCRCDRAYCKTHRHPDAHKCGVDLKEVDRKKLDTDQKRGGGAKAAFAPRSNQPLAPKSKSDIQK